MTNPNTMSYDDMMHPCTFCGTLKAPGNCAMCKSNMKLDLINDRMLNDMRDRHRREVDEGADLTTLRASLAAMTERAEKAEAAGMFKAAMRKLDAATAALLALGCELRDGVWVRPEEDSDGLACEKCGTFEHCNLCCPRLHGKPISPPPSPASAKIKS